MLSSINGYFDIFLVFDYPNSTLTRFTNVQMDSMMISLNLLWPSYFAHNNAVNSLPY